MAVRAKSKINNMQAVNIKFMGNKWRKARKEDIFQSLDRT